MTMKKIVLVVGVFLVLFNTVFVFARGERDGAGVEIAVAGSHSGDLAPLGIPTRRAVELVFGDIKNLTVHYQDDQCDPNSAANVASSIIGTKALVVVGHVCSGATEAALNVYKQTGVSAVSANATSPALTKSGKHKGLFFRTIAPDDAQGETQARFLIDALKVKSVAVVHDKGDYGKGLAKYASDALKASGVSVKLHEGITVGAADYSTIVNKIASLNVDAVVFGGYHPEASRLVIQLRRRGVGAAFIGGDAVQSTAFAQLVGENVENVYATGPRDNSSNALYKKARSLHLKKYSEEPGAFFYEGYAAALVVKKTLEALQKKGTPLSAAAVASYIADAKNSFDTPVGTISFDKNGDATGLGFSVYEVQKGKFTKIE